MFVIYNSNFNATDKIKIFPVNIFYTTKRLNVSMVGTWWWSEANENMNGLYTRGYAQ